jgi:DNA-damage-inducible protein J
MRSIDNKHTMHHTDIMKRKEIPMSSTTNVSIRMDSNLKRDAENLFADLGLNMTSALTMFIRQAVRTQSIPFEITRQPNAETIAAMQEAKSIARDPNIKGYDDLNELLGDFGDLKG